MLKNYYRYILLCLGILLTTPLYAAYQLAQEGKDNEPETNNIPNKPIIGYYNYTLKYNKKNINNIVDPNELEEEKKYLKESNITTDLKDKKGTIFFMVVMSNKQTQELSKFFFFNKNPNTETKTVKKVQTLFRFHVISHVETRLAPHVIFQLLGWLEQQEKRYIPIFIHVNTPVCITCDAVMQNLLNVNTQKSTNGCLGKIPDLEKICPLAQKYIQSSLTLPMAKKFIVPSISLQHNKDLKSLNNSLSSISEQATKLLLEKEDLQKRFDRLKKEKTILKKSSINRVIKIYKITKKPTAYFGYNDSQKVVDIQHSINQVTSGPLKGHTESVRSVAVTADNRYIVSGSDDNTIRIWDFKTGKPVGKPLQGHTYWVESVAVTADNKYIVSGSWDDTIRIWELETGKEVRSLQGHTSTVNSVAVTSDNRYIVSGSNDKTIRI